MKKLAFIFVVIIITYGFQCNNCENEIDRTISLNLDIIPRQIIYSQFDTISLKAKFSSQFKINESDEIYDNSNQGGYFKFMIYKIEKNNTPVFEGLNHFEIIDENMNYQETSTYSQFKNYEFIINFNCNDSNCEIDIKLIPLIKGYFAFAANPGYFSNEVDDCVYNHIDAVEISPITNNFEICKEINTTKLYIEMSPNGRASKSDPQNSNSLYFFKVE